MRLNETLAELNDNNFDEYGEGKYYLTVMGTPSAHGAVGLAARRPSLDHQLLRARRSGRHDAVVLGLGAGRRDVGQIRGTSIMDDEQDAGLAMVRALTAQQRERAILEPKKTGNDIRAQLFSDNVVLDYAGVPVVDVHGAQKQQLLDLIELYVGNLRDEHARVHLADVEAQLDDTYFAWIGETDDDSVFYYRIHSPVVLIEFDHQTPVGLTHLYPRGVPYREHIHAVVRTPNGNDYGKDLLRQHYERTRTEVRYGFA